MDIRKRLGQERLFLDGAIGTMLQKQGLAIGEQPELWNITHPQIVRELHSAYVQAGCDIITANTFGANRLKLKGYTPQEIISAGVSLARQAAGDRAVALDIGPTGKLLAPFGDLPFETAVDVFAQMVEAGVQAGADLILIETMSDTYEIKAAMLAAKEHSTLPVIVSFTLDSAARLLTGADIQSAICLIESLGADALGVNCGLGPAQLRELLPVLCKFSSLPLVLMPNAGVPELRNGETVFRVSPEDFAQQMAQLAGSAHILGGCCGTTPAHMAQMIAACKPIPPAPITEKHVTAVSSYGKTVVFAEQTVLIGERINPTGKPRMKQALRESDWDYLYREGLAQIAQGAQILDVNVGIPGIDEAAVLAQVLCGLQSVTDAPLQIDTADLQAASQALRLYNGKPLLNSVSGKQESLETVLPLAKKYGAAVVALTLDENGIPETAAGRIAIARRILDAAKHYGIAKKDILIDALTMTVSTNDENARITLETMEYCRRELAVHTVLGVSNISFGLPQRELLNAAFFSLAMERGLSGAIMNPMNAAMMDAYYAHRVLRGKDSHCSAYISRFSSVTEAARTANYSLCDAVRLGLKEQAGSAARQLLLHAQPLEIINGQLIPALDQVGKAYEEKRAFLPQLLSAAEAAKSAFEAIKVHMAGKGETSEKRGKIVLATVKGDIHDIGKNILKVLLENYHFSVIDLGRDVDPMRIVQAVCEEKAPLVGLSALMTTTVVYMQQTIELLRKHAGDCRVMVGGAVLTQEFADEMGADFYAENAMAGVRYADEIFQ
ncbi:MAG: homocysteine S-methyltransferase family protein [Oscillospiraceae bacterium]|jgi:5-methyltetrahydrofolate--homocysteine methyltransferase|nr:homocysteine S-methyltransferase family protein [Oscillospiraceae bacterium]